MGTKTIFPVGSQGSSYDCATFQFILTSLEHAHQENE